MKVKSFCFLLLTQFILQGCPLKEEEGYQPDTPLYIKNVSTDTVVLRARIRRSLTSSDNFVNDDDAALLYREINDLSKAFRLAPNERKQYYQISTKGISNSPVGDHYFFVSLDTLLNYTPETWNRRAGVKYYYLYSLGDYERINFTFEYP
jgi:hypothetical protein